MKKENGFGILALVGLGIAAGFAVKKKFIDGEDQEEVSDEVIDVEINEEATE